MSGKTAYLENAVLKLLFQAVAIANFADDAASSPATNLYLSLHTQDPTDAPATEQTQYETTYTSYARVAVVRTSSGWTVTGNVLTPAADIDFPQCTGGTATITYAGIGTAASGNGKLLWSGALSPSIAVSNGVIPRITEYSTITES
jgi:hypothetical protein